KEKNQVIDLLEQVTAIIKKQQELFGLLLTNEIIPCLKEEKIYLLYNEPIPLEIQTTAREFFFSHLLAFIQIVPLIEASSDFFTESNKLYATALLERGHKESTVIINIPSDQVPRFFKVRTNDVDYVVFIEDIIEENLPLIFFGAKVNGVYNFKI